jgi:hypothetical protein
MSPVSVPTQADFAELASTVQTLVGRQSLVLRPEDYVAGGQVPADWTAAFTALMDDLEGSLAPDEGGSVPVCTAVILLSGASYPVSGTIMVAKPGRAEGLTIMGLGKRSSEIVKTAPGPLLVNQDRWMGVRIKGCSFRGAVAGAEFLYSYASTGAQDWNFDNVEWRGTWNYGIGLDGNNLNSEFGWNNCQIGGDYGIAFLYGGMQPAISQQDQFLNYWFNDCKVEFNSGTFVRMDRGGFVKCQGGSYILEGTRADGGISQFFDFPVAGHADSVQKLAVRDVRFELRNSTHRIITSLWNGQVVFDGCSDTALGFEPFSAALVTSDYTNPGIVTYRNCDLTGKHAYHATAPLVRQTTLFEGCTRKNNRTAATFLVTDGADAASLRFVYVADGDNI